MESRDWLIWFPSEEAPLIATSSIWNPIHWDVHRGKWQRLQVYPVPECSFLPHGHVVCAGSVHTHGDGGKLEGVMLPVLALMALASFEAAQPLPQAFQYYSACKTAAARLFEVVDKDDGKMTRESSVNHALGNQGGIH